MAISAGEVKALRDATGAGMMDCKRALEEAEGDSEKAKDILRQRGQAKGGKREGKQTAEGCIALAAADDHRHVAVLELNCETDFVGRTDDFRALAAQLADQALAKGAAEADQLDAEDLLNEAVSRLGEAIRVGRIEQWQAADGGLIASYLHTATHKVAVVLELGVDGQAATADVLRVGAELAMQVAAMRPVAVGRDDVPAELVEREKEVLRQADDMADKPPQVQEKIIAGRLDKLFFQQACLLEQEYVRESGTKVSAYLAAEGKRLGATLSVRRFVRTEVGVA